MSESKYLTSTLLIAICELVACGPVDGGQAFEWHDAGGAHSVSGTGGRSSGGTASLSTGGTTVTSCELGGSITADTRWAPDANCPDGYDVVYSVSVSGAGTKLVIEPGTKLKFASGTILEVESSASLVAVGTSDKPVTLTGWQQNPGAWGGIVIKSGSTENEISHALVEYGGQADVLSANIAVWYDSQPAQLKLSSTQSRFSKRFGLALSQNVTLKAFENNIITKNEGGAARASAGSVHQLKGSKNSFVENGEGNMVRIEADSLMEVDQDVTWPNLSPAAYRVTGANGERGDQIYVKGHLTIEAGTIFEFVGGSGIDVSDGASGLSAIGTGDAPIVFRGVNGSGWTGIGFCESNWSGNALEQVLIANAAGPTHADPYCGSGGTTNAASVLVGHNFSSNASALRIKDVRFSGPSSADRDIQVKSPSKLTLEGTNTGTGANGELAREDL